MEVRFITSAADLAGRPPEVLPEFAFVGRSNCGKSSLINHFLRRRGMAKTSGKPGKTRLLNYFLVSERYYLVDLPGYGFAKVSKDLRAGWLRLFEAYLGAGDRPLAVFQLLDARHAPSDEDRQMSALIQAADVPFALAATKIDKVGNSKHRAHFGRIVEGLDVPPETPFFPTSARLGSGRDEMLAWVEALLAAAED